MQREARHVPRRVLVTGGAGFIGSNFIRHVARTVPRLSILNLDALTYAGDPDGLNDVAESLGEAYRFVRADIRDREAVARVFAEFQPDTVVNFAAESHVDRSIDSPLECVETNVVGTVNLLMAAKALWGGRTEGVRFHQVSTDEVYGTLGETGCFTETTRYEPSSPYSASKASADHLVRAWHATFRLPVTISNCSNNYGPRQFPEKLIPLMISNALQHKPLPVYGDGGNIRDWLYVLDHCEAVWLIVTAGVVGRTYNIGGNNERTNIELVRMICDILQRLRPSVAGGYRDLITFVSDRPGHDFRYAIDCARIRDELGWRPRHDFASGLEETVRWYLDNREWTERIRRLRYDGARLGQRE